MTYLKTGLCAAAILAALPAFALAQTGPLPPQGGPGVYKDGAQLAAALDTFSRIGARPWAERTRNEIRATGVTAASNTGTSAVTLTPQQRQIAVLAAQGLTNKQIGERLFLSPRTVATHLYQLFPKLGITSRAALGDAIARQTQSSD